MSDGDSTRQAKDLRDHATSLLRKAARCGDPAQRDDLLRTAVARLDEARRLLDRLGDKAEGLGSSPARKMH